MTKGSLTIWGRSIAITITICSKCKQRIRLKSNGKWYDVTKEDVDFLELKPCSHGLCADCFGDSVDDAQKLFSDCIFRECAAHEFCEITDFSKCEVYDIRRNKYVLKERVREEKG